MATWKKQKHLRFAIATFAAVCLSISTSCSQSDLLSPEPSALDLDSTSPTCPGLTSVTVTSGPSLTVTWGEASDNLSQSSSLAYSVFMRAGVSSYDLVSPTKIVNGATTTIISSGIQLGQSYTLFVSCKDEAGNVYPTGPTNEIAVTVNDATPPTAITDLDASNPNYTTMLLTWSPSDDGAGGTTSSQMKYRLFFGTSSPVSTAGSPLVTLTGATSYTHTGLVPGTTYYYRVVAEDIAANRSADSNEDSNSTLTDATVPTLTPALGTTAITTSSIGLTWSAGADNVTAAAGMKYNVYRCSGSTTCDPYAIAHIFQTSAGQTTYTDSPLTANTIYVYGVRAVDSSGNVSTNADRLVVSTSYTSIGQFNFYPTTQEVGLRFGFGTAVANVIGTASGAGAYPDLIVGAPNASEPGSTYANTGCVYIFAGTATGVFSSTPTQTTCQPSATAGGANSRNFGTQVAAGDMDDNGTMDLVVSSPQQNRIFILRSTNTSGTLSIGGSSSIIASGATTTFGYGLCLGNSDNSGATDIFVVIPTDNCQGGCGGLTGTGNVAVYSNTSSAGSFVLPTLALTFSPTTALQGAPNTYTLSNGEQTVRTCTMGRFDPSSPATDVLVLGSGIIEHDANPGTQNDGGISFYRRTGVNAFTYQNTLLGLTMNPPGLRDSQWGDGLATVQVDGVGAPELFVGAPNDSSAGAAAGAVYGYSVTTSASNFVLTDLGNYYYGGSDQANNGTGTSIAAADIWAHGDGKQDLVVGSPYDDRTAIVSATNIEMGDVFTYKNISGVIGPAIQQQEFDVSSVNARISNDFGRGTCRGDINNDGIEDIMVGSPGQSYDPNTLVYSGSQGALYVYYGVASGEIDFANPSTIMFGPGNQGSAFYGYSCLVMDYNADGENDLLVGSPWRDVGANGDRGAVFIYYGVDNGPLPLVNSATLNAPPLHPNVYFGFSMSKGDFDNSGDEDLVVGSPLYDAQGTDTGAAWIFWANTSTGVIMPSTSVTTLTMPYGNAGTAGNLHLANNMPAANVGTITAASRTANVVTITTSAAHGLTAGRVVYISGVTGATSFNGSFTVASAPTGTTFTYAQTAGNEVATLSSPTYASSTQLNSRFGYAVQAFPTVIGSTGVDLVVCAPYLDTNAGDVDTAVGALGDIGTCLIFEGKVNGGLGGNYAIMTLPRNEIRYPYGLTGYGASSQFFGTGMAIGDWDNDGVTDLVIGAFRMRNLDLSINNLGAVFAYRGRATGGFETATGWHPNFAGARNSPLADDVYFNTNTEAGLTDFGTGILLADVNNNNRDDLIVGQPTSDNFGGPSNLGANSGNVFVIRGGF